MKFGPITSAPSPSKRRSTHQVHHTVRLFLAVSGNIARNPIFIEINMNHLLTLPRRVGKEVIVWCDPHTRLGRGEYRLQVNHTARQSWEGRTFGRSPVCGTWCIPRLNHSILTHQLYQGKEITYKSSWTNDSPSKNLSKSTSGCPGS
jgi:hypothetical protein